MGNPWELKYITEENGRSIYHYAVGGFVCEIDGVSGGYVVGDANFDYLDKINIKAKTRQVLLERLERCF